VRDIVGLYLSPPNRALVLSIDEKSQIQALDREQPVLPMMPGVPERRTHSYVRHGTTSLFAALDFASGFVIGKCYKRHRAEFLNFLKEVDANVPEGLGVHIVMDNYATHKTPKIKAWLTRRRHYHVHSKPISTPSSTGTTKTPSLSNGPNQPTKSSLQSNASVRKHSAHYAVNFRFM